MLLFVDGEDVPGTVGKVACGGHVGEQHEAARLVLPPDDALGLGAYSRLEPITDGFDRARLVGTGPTAAIDEPFLHGDVDPMVWGGQSAERHRRGFRISTTEILPLFCKTGSSVERALCGLDVTCQPLLPPFVMRAGVHHHRALRRPVECDFAL